MKKSALVIVLLLSLVMTGNAQQPFKIRTIQTGERVPDLVFSHMANFRSQHARLSDFKGKVVILDFWNKNCPSCIAAIPKMEEIQREYGDKVQILLVNCINRLEDLKGFPKNSSVKLLRNTDLPYVLGVPEFKKLFYHELEPYDVWIDAGGIMRASTTGYNVSSQHVKEFLQGEEPKMRDLTGGSRIEASIGQTILRPQNAWVLGKVSYHSALLPELFVGSVNGGLYDSATGKMIGFLVTDADMSFLFRIANQFQGGRDRVVYEVKNPERFFEPSDPNEEDEWRMKWNFGYEIVLPVVACPDDDKESWRRISLYMRQDLERSLGITSHIERRVVKCLCLVTVNDSINLATSGGVPHYETPLEGFKSTNGSLDAFCEVLKIANCHLGSLPIVNSTNYSKGVDIQISCPLGDIPSVRRELARYGLDLVESDRELEVLVLKDVE